MRRVIHKWPLTITDHCAYEMPRDAKILTVQAQRDVPCIWAEVDPDAATELRHIRIYGTGHQMDVDSFSHVYIGTFQTHDGDLVFHVYEDKS